jgi:hypothetical protein
MRCRHTLEKIREDYDDAKHQIDNAEETQSEALLRVAMAINNLAAAVLLAANIDKGEDTPND